MDRPGKNGGTLRSFEKGKSGNPAGRPPKRDLISRLLAEYGQEDNLALTIRGRDVNGVWHEQQLSYEVDGKENTVLAIIAVELMMRACEGDFKAIKIILDRTEGRVPPPMRINPSANGQAVVVVSYQPKPVDEPELAP